MSGDHTVCRDHALTNARWSEADVMYGVTMQEPGVSKIVSVNLNKAERRVA